MREELEKQKNEVSQNRFKTQQQTQRISVLGDELKNTKNTLKVSKKSVNAISAAAEHTKTATLDAYRRYFRKAMAAFSKMTREDEPLDGLKLEGGEKKVAETSADNVVSKAIKFKDIVFEYKSTFQVRPTQ